jgi:hypothetical protein
MRTRLPLHAAVLLVLVAVTLATLPTAQAATVADQPGQIEAAARQRVAQNAPGVALERVEVVRIVQDYALVAVYPAGGLTDPAGVILRRQDGTWTAVAGPGTAFPPGSRAGAPDALFDFGPPSEADQRA